MLTASLNDRMPGWLTLDNALWCLTVLAMIAAVCIMTLYAGREREEPIDWDAPASDADEVDDYAGDIPPVVWDEAIHGYVCAAKAERLPGGKCGYPVTDDMPCPEHGRRASAGAA